MTNRAMIFGCLVLITLMFTGCNRNYLVFGTYTEFDVAGVEAKPTGDVALKIGYDRAETAFVPDNGKDGYSVLGTFDSDILLFSGYYINEVFATGEAAKIASAEIAGVDYEPGEEPTGKVGEPLLLSTGTRFGFHSIFSANPAGAGATPVDIMLGYKRANLAVVPTVAPDENDQTARAARSTYAEIVIGEGSKRKRAAEIVRANPENQGNGPLGQGIVINQRIATGLAARHLAESEKVQNKLMNLDSGLKTVNDLSDEMKTELEKIKDQTAFEQAKLKLAKLAAVKPEGISAGNFIQTAQAYLDVEGLKTLLAFMKQLEPSDS